MTTVERGIVLAAGRGHRLVNGSGIPKPLVRVGGRTLIDHVLRAFESAGLREAVVVVGYLGHQIREALRDRPGIRVTIVENKEWHKSNGLSLLCAADHIDGPCILSMSDHLYDAAVVKALCRAPQVDGECHLGVDDSIEEVFDIDDATKVRRRGDRIVSIGKELSEYDGIDTGVFRVGPALVAALRGVFAERGDCSLSDGVRILCGEGRMKAVRIADELWLDVDTPEALRYAEVVCRLRERRSDARPEAGGVNGDHPHRTLPTWS